MADIVKIATDMLDACARLDFTAAYASASPVLVSGVPEFILAETWNRIIRMAGPMKQISGTRGYRHLLAPLSVVVVVCEFERATVEVQFGFDQEGLIVGMSVLTPGLG